MEGLRVTRSLVLPPGELHWRFGPSGGPGGQHANTANTRAEVRFDIASSPSLGPRQRARLLAAFGPEVKVSAADERSQIRNRALALERLAGRLAGALVVQRTRTPTRPSASARRRRVDDKRRRSDLKRTRQRPPRSDD